ncbi:hypothetical protein [Thermobacillus sp. ZCTH02-B1]|uniref:hypothetical protein n=1 Tax=Thermobacillus sp. ZCTH02-B1 TaxID=1858795 RepID=UPI0025D6DB1F|nr:hypothetical protein [Thermobacillus sp. ZCTH02-B1]
MAMTQAAPTDRDLYEDLAPERDVLFFRVGGPELVFFDGRNFKLKKRLSSDRIALLRSDPNFCLVAPDTYVNLRKVSEFDGEVLYFGEKGPDAKRLPVSRWRRGAIRELIANRK